MKSIAIYGGESHSERLFFAILFRDSIHGMKFMNVDEPVNVEDRLIKDSSFDGAVFLYDLDEESISNISCISFEQEVPVIVMIPRNFSWILESISFSRRFLIINLDKE